MKIPVAIVEDNADLRSALEQIIGLSDNYKLSASYVNGEEALKKLPRTNAKVVMMDINLGGISGIEVVRELKPQFPDMLFMMCTVYEDDEKIFEALRAGASGYMLKKTPPSKMVEALNELVEGGAPMNSQIASKVVAAFQSTKKDEYTAAVSAGGENETDVLSKREMEILQMLSKGLLYKEIADQLFISPETVRKHVYHIYEKLHVNNRIEAVNKFFKR